MQASEGSIGNTTSECASGSRSQKQPQVGARGAKAPDKPILSPAKQGGSGSLRQTDSRGLTKRKNSIISKRLTVK